MGITTPPLWGSIAVWQFHGKNYAETQKPLISKFSKPNSIHKDTFLQILQKILQKHIYWKNCADVEFHNRIKVKPPFFYSYIFSKNSVIYLLWDSKT
jgi:hypothetical protein